MCFVRWLYSILQNTKIPNKCTMFSIPATWDDSESPRARVAKLYGRLRLIRSIWRASTLSVFKIVILWVYYTIPFGFNLFWQILVISFQLFLNYIVWVRITDEGSVPEIRIWSISLIQSEYKWCIHLSRSLYLNIVLHRDQYSHLG